MDDPERRLEKLKRDNEKRARKFSEEKIDQKFQSQKGLRDSKSRRRRARKEFKREWKFRQELEEIENQALALYMETLKEEYGNWAKKHSEPSQVSNSTTNSPDEQFEKIHHFVSKRRKKIFTARKLEKKANELRELMEREFQIIPDSDKVADRLVQHFANYESIEFSKSMQEDFRAWKQGKKLPCG